jgi:hypothetical protein
MGDDIRVDIEALPGPVNAVCSPYPSAFLTINLVHEFKSLVAEETVKNHRARCWTYLFLDHTLTYQSPI